MGRSSHLLSRFFLTYDHLTLLKAVKPLIVDTLIAQFAFGTRRNTVIILGSGKNQKIFNDLNLEYGWFETVYVLEHPRFIMQYRRRKMQDYLNKYQDIFSRALLRRSC